MERINKQNLLDNTRVKAEISRLINEIKNIRDGADNIENNFYEILSARMISSPSRIAEDRRAEVLREIVSLRAEANRLETDFEEVIASRLSVIK
jgi:hypothetical protein